MRASLHGKRQRVVQSDIPGRETTKLLSESCVYYGSFCLCTCIFTMVHGSRLKGRSSLGTMYSTELMQEVQDDGNKWCKLAYKTPHIPRAAAPRRDLVAPLDGLDGAFLQRVGPATGYCRSKLASEGPRSAFGRAIKRLVL